MCSWWSWKLKSIFVVCDGRWRAWKELEGAHTSELHHTSCLLRDQHRLTSWLRESGVQELCVYRMLVSEEERQVILHVEFLEAAVFSVISAYKKPTHLVVFYFAIYE